jgi:RHS repeat-associated protein
MALHAEGDRHDGQQAFPADADDGAGGAQFECAVADEHVVQSGGDGGGGAGSGEPGGLGEREQSEHHPEGDGGCVGAEVRAELRRLGGERAEAGDHVHDFGGGTVVGGSAGGAILSAASHTEQASMQLARFDTLPRMLSDAPVIAARALLDPPPVTDVVTKTYYYAGSSLIAMRVLTGTTGNTLYYLHSDHLGSTSLTTDVNGAVVARQYYYPYGGIRPGPNNALPTDITFTGQRMETGLGSLMFFRARFYSPLVGRFLSADAVVPGAGNPQALNRYSYGLNNPLKYTDPTGHDVDCAVGEARSVCQSTQPDTSPTWEELFGISLEGQWTEDDRIAIYSAVMDEGLKLQGFVGGKAWEAFRKVYGTSSSDPLRIVWGTSAAGLSSECAGAVNAGCTSSPHLINFTFDKGSIYEETANRNGAMAFALARNNVVHELGHAFALRWYNTDGTYDASGPYTNIPRELVGGDEGFAESPPSAQRTWRQHPCVASDSACPHETFADMFLGWTYNTWGSREIVDRDGFMTTNMADWVVAATTR